MKELITFVFALVMGIEAFIFYNSSDSAILLLMVLTLINFTIYLMILNRLEN